MKVKLATILFSSLFLTGCLSIMIDLASSQDYHTKWDHQCLALTQDVELRKGRSTDTFSKNFITAYSSLHIPSHLKERGVLPKNTRFEVVKVYDRYVHGVAGNWHLRVNLKILDGAYKDLEVEIPGIFPGHPEPLLFTNSTQKIAFTARENLQPNSIEFNPEFLTACP